MTRRKLIEVALPLEEINKASAKEKSIRHGHPSTLHLWWSRKPLATARAVLFAQLVDDPDSTPEAEAIADPGEREAWVKAERERLFDLIRELVKWENTGNESLFKRAHQEILRSTGGNPPPILDPFAGGGSIPLEAQRLGLEAHASDLNPVAVLINKALIEIPPKFAGRPPAFPGAAEERLGDWPGATGLAEDVRRYSQWMRDEAEKRIGYLYPKARLEDGTDATVIAWIWARTVKCPNPACGVDMPLVSKWWLGKKKGKEAYIVPGVVDAHDGRKIEYRICHDPKQLPATMGGTIERTGGTCVSCQSSVELKYIRAEGKAARMGVHLMAVAGEGHRRRVYVAPDETHLAAADTSFPITVPRGDLAYDPRAITAPNYGLGSFSSLFTSRQLAALSTFSDLVGEAREKIFADCLVRDVPTGSRLSDGGDGAAAYADAVATYLGLGVSRYANFQNALCQWRPDAGKEQVGHLFSRQAIPMAWDFAEANPFSASAGGWTPAFQFIPKVLDQIITDAPRGVVTQEDAAISHAAGLLSTDPPYYDNIGYSDLSDFFYVWLRRCLTTVHPAVLGTLLVPKVDELVANPYRNGGKDGAKKFFEDGFHRFFTRAREQAAGDFPATVYYAFKQSESSRDGEISTGWETLLEGMVGSGWSITATWPMRSELGNRTRSQGSNALASSIVLALRSRPAIAPATERRTFLKELRGELPTKLKELQQGSIAPVDLAQVAIGPGMAVYSKYREVIEPDGSRMSVRRALGLINQVLDEVLSEQEGDFDSATRWCVKWFEARGFDEGPYGEAEQLALSRNTSVAGLDRSGAVRSRAGRVKLVHPDDLPVEYDPRRDNDITLWEVVCHMAKALNEKGIDAAGGIMAGAAQRVDLDAAKELAYLAYSIAERKGWSQIGQFFNTLGTTWSEVVMASRNHHDDQPEQGALDLFE